jgi:rubrerythrin
MRMSGTLVELLTAARAAEKRQALYYRALAAAAEAVPDPPLAERLNDLHADEQHHLSRLTARLLELGADTPELEVTSTPGELRGWEAVARQRELEEVERYAGLLRELELDAHTEGLLREILDTERHHAAELGGKWTPA